MVCNAFRPGLWVQIVLEPVLLVDPGISARQQAKSSATSKVMGTNSTPRNSPIFLAKMAGHPPAWPPKIVCKAWRCLFIGPFVEEEAHPNFGFIGPGA